MADSRDTTPRQPQKATGVEGLQSDITSSGSKSTPLMSHAFTPRISARRSDGPYRRVVHRRPVADARPKTFSLCALGSGRAGAQRRRRDRCRSASSRRRERKVEKRRPSRGDADGLPFVSGLVLLVTLLRFSMLPREQSFAHAQRDEHAAGAVVGTPASSQLRSPSFPPEARISSWAQ